MDANEQLRLEMIKNNKDRWFVGHIQTHIDNNHFGKNGKDITPGKVGCVICGKDIDQIAEDALLEIDNMLRIQNEGEKK